MADVSKITLPNGDEYNIKDANRGVQLTMTADSTAQTVTCVDQAMNNIPVLNIPSYLDDGATMYLIYQGERYIFMGEYYEQTTVSTSGTVDGDCYRFTKFDTVNKFVTVEVGINKADGSLHQLAKITKDYAPVQSPTFTGTPRAPTPTSGDNSTQIATTAYVQDSVIKNIVDLEDVNAYSPSKGEVLVYDGASIIAKHGWFSTDATWIGYDNYRSGLSADYVGEAIDELDARKSVISTTWNDITNSTSPLPNTARYTGKEIHCIANDVDASLSDNGISSTQYAGMYVQDGEKNNIGKCAVDIYNTGMVEMQLYAQNKGTGSNVSNYLSLQVANDGTKSVSVNAPVAWRQAIGPELLTSSPSSFSDKTISTGGSWTNLGSQAFPKGGLYLVLYTVRWDEVTSGSSITVNKGYRKTCIASTSTGSAISNQHLCLGPSTPTDDTVQEMTCVINTLSATNNQTQYFQCAQTSGYSMAAMGRYTIIRLV